MLFIIDHRFVYNQWFRFGSERKGILLNFENLLKGAATLT